MTECNKKIIAWNPQKRRKIESDFNGGRLVSDGGLLLLRQVDQHINLTTNIANAIVDPRDPTKIQHAQSAMIAARIHAIAAGYEDLNDHDILRRDPMLQLCAGVAPTETQTLASASTLCRLENRITRADCVALHRVLVEQFVASFDEPPTELILDFDPTDDRIHGQQEGRFYHGYYRDYCYLPLYVFCGEQLLVAYLRSSNIDGAKHTRAILKLLVDRFRAAWPGVKIILRGDGGFCRWKLMRWCDRHGIHYILGLPKNEKLKKIAAPFMKKAEEDYQREQVKQRHFYEICYGAGTWDRKRKVIAKAEYLSEGPNLRFIVTNLDGDGQELYDEVYCARGEMENRIKEQQLGLFADRTSCAKMVANQFRLLLSGAAYVLMQTLRGVGLAGTELAKAQVGTIRLKLLKIAGRVMFSSRRVVVHLSSTCVVQSLLRSVVANLDAANWDTS